MKKVAILAALSLALASCTTTSSQEAAAKTYDRICSLEPPVYSTLSLAAEANGWNAAKKARIEAAHLTVTNLCTNRPTDLVSGLTTLAATYAQILILKKQAE